MASYWSYWVALLECWPLDCRTLWEEPQPRLRGRFRTIRHCNLTRCRNLHGGCYTIHRRNLRQRWRIAVGIEAAMQYWHTLDTAAAVEASAALPLGLLHLIHLAKTLRRRHILKPTPEARSPPQSMSISTSVST